MGISHKYGEGGIISCLLDALNRRRLERALVDAWLLTTGLDPSDLKVRWSGKLVGRRMGGVSNRGTREWYYQFNP